MIRFAACDDEPFMLQELSAQLAQYMESRDTAYQFSRFADGGALLESGGDFDLVFLDIQMRQPDGMETARRLRRQGSRSLLVFVTVLQERVFDAFEVQAFDYLVKPLDPVRFRRILDRALQTLEQPQSLLLQKGGACQVIPLAQIVYCEVQGRKLYVHQADGSVAESYGRLEALEKRVDSRFFKCHRSYLVGLDYIRGCQDGQAILSTGEKIPVSRLRERDMMQALLRRMHERGP